MAANLYPLVYKAGIKRDGTTFQPEYCTDGQWIRFSGGKIRKMGGMLGFQAMGLGCTYIRMFPQNDDKVLVFACVRTKIRPYLIIDDDFNYFIGDSNEVFTSDGIDPDSILWQGAAVIHNAKQYMVFMGSPILQNITQNTPSVYTTCEVVTNNIKFTKHNNLDPDAEDPNLAQEHNANLNGGLCYSNPYLFLYGSNGLVQYSSSINPFDFKGDDSGALTISSDKVIYGAPIRGGSNAPSLLFWTLSSVVRVINTGAEKVDFQIDVISKSSSIISTRCVVEYDGLFFWPGTDRFFVYNGVVQEMSNNINLDYFFNNVDLDYRQKIFGIEQPLYGEIWWFYPEKMGAPNRDSTITEGHNTRAIIYNKKENSWYDTAISREAGTFCDELGMFMTYGEPLVRAGEVGADIPRFWVHERGSVQENHYYNRDIVKQPPMFLNIPAYIKLPTISWAAFNPGGQSPGGQNEQGGGKGIDRWVSLKRFEPDFIMSKAEDEMEIIVNSKEYAQSTETKNITLPFTGKTEKLDFITQGRHITLTFKFNGSSSVEMGQCLLTLGIGDKR